MTDKKKVEEIGDFLVEKFDMQKYNFLGFSWIVLVSDSNKEVCLTFDLIRQGRASIRIAISAPK